MPDDALLLRRYARERAEDAFAELVRRHLDGVYSAALRRVGGDTHLAEDVAQQVFVALACNAARLSEREILSGWLYTTTRHLAANVVRTERRRKAREQQANFMSDVNTDSSAAADWSRMAPLLDDAMDQLGESDRAVILLRFVERRAFGEIGAALRVKEDAARMRSERALEKLRALLERRGIASTSAALGLVLTNHAVAAAPAGLAAAVTTTASVAAPPSALIALGAAEIMSTAKSLGLAVALVALTVALGTALYETNAHREAEAALATEQKARAAQLARRDEAERRAQQSEAAVALLRKTVDDARTAQAAAKARAAAETEAARKEAAWDGVAEGKALFARHPEVKRVFDASKLAEVRARYAPFFASAHLTPGQIEEFIRLKAAGSMNGFPYGPGGKQLLLAFDTGFTLEEAAADLKTLLGEEGFKQFQDYGTMITARDTVERVANAVVFSDAPLSPAQANELVQTVVNAQVKPSGSKSTVTDWDAVAERARSFLAEPQLRALASVRVQNEARRAALPK